MQPRVDRLRVHVAIDRRISSERRSHGPAVEAAGIKPGKVQQRRGDIDEAQRAGHVPSVAGAARQTKDPRDVKRFAIQQDTVLGFSVIAEPLAMIGHHRDDRAILPAARLEAIEQPPDELIRIGDLAVVRAGELV